MSDKLFDNTVQFPQDIHSILSMNINYEKLESVINFILSMLDRHEKGLKIAFGKSDESPTEAINFHSIKENFESKFAALEKNVAKNRQKIDEIKSDLDSRGDTVETLKYVLTTIDEHNSAFLRSEKLHNEFLTEKGKLESEIENLQNTIKSFSESSEPELKKSPTQISEVMNEVNSKQGQAKYFGTNQRLLNNSGFIHLQKPETQKTLDLHSQNPEKPYSLNRDNTEIPSVLSKNSGHVTSQKQEIFEPGFPNKNFREAKESYLNLKNPIKHSENSEEEEKVSVSSADRSFRNTPVFNKSPMPPDRKRQEKVLPVLNQSSQITEIQSRLDSLEKQLSKPVDPEITMKIGKLETMYKFIEGIVDSCEPLSLKNRDQILHLVRNLKDLEYEMTNKLNTEDFDTIRNLVITIASGSSKHDVTSIVPTQEVNKIRLLEKRISELEKNFSDIVKVYPENIEEVILKLRRIEQKLKLKVNENQLEPLNKSIEDLAEKIRTLNANGIQRVETKKKTVKTVDNLVINSIHKRISECEELVKSLNIPKGMNISQLWEEVKKNWQDLQSTKVSIEDWKKQEMLKKSEIFHKVEDVQDHLLRKIDESCKQVLLEVNEKCAVLYASRKDLKRVTKELENSVKADLNKSKPEVDDAMIAKKPLGGWSCASCEKKLDRLSGRLPSHSPWKKLPFRDVSERMLKAGLGYSKMLTGLQIEILKNRNETEDSSVIYNRHTDRSITPHL